MRHFLIVAATLAVVSPRPLAAQAPQLSTRDSALHALNRLAYGPRPGEVDSVARIGVMRWIDQQLDPDRIDDAALQRREREFKILSYDREDLAQRFRDVQRERQRLQRDRAANADTIRPADLPKPMRSEEHTSELQSHHPIS